MTAFGVPPNPRGLTDTHVESEKPCCRRTWCVLAVGHDGPCEEVPRGEMEKPDFGPKRARSMRW